VINILSNALKYTIKGEIKIIVNNESNQDLKISVEDTGVGIDES
jgi:signal transduction histidine kinase